VDGDGERGGIGSSGWQGGVGDQDMRVFEADLSGLDEKISQSNLSEQDDSTGDNLGIDSDSRTVESLALQHADVFTGMV